MQRAQRIGNGGKQKAPLFRHFAIVAIEQLAQNGLLFSLRDIVMIDGRFALRRSQRRALLTGPGQSPLDQNVSAVANPGHHTFFARHRQFQRIQGVINGSGQARRAIDQRPIEIERHAANIL